LIKDASGNPMSNAALALRQLLSRHTIARCAGAHDAAGARVAEHAGFDAVWSSSFEISASYCVPDASILSMSDYLHVARSISESVSIPVIADCDTGYGNAANVAHAVKKFEAAGVAAISIEDQVFPKTNSLVRGAQKLVSIAEFTEKIRVAKQAQQSSDFVIIARVEALIAGMGQRDAQRRAHAYAAAGADAVLIHWNQASPEPIRQFLREWDHPVPTIVIPTTYHEISLQELAESGASMVIYANHGMRSALRAMEETFRSILADGTTSNVEDSLWPIARVLEELQGMPDTTTLRDDSHQSCGERPCLVPSGTQPAEG
jgi:phosphoenolpyruvate phosphomutase